MSRPLSRPPTGWSFPGTPSSRVAVLPVDFDTLLLCTFGWSEHAADEVTRHLDDGWRLEGGAVVGGDWWWMFTRAGGEMEGCECD